MSNGMCLVNGIRVNVQDSNLTKETAHNIVQGWYENVEREFVREYIPSDSSVVELGGGIGYISTYISRQLDSPSTHIVVEANERLIPSIENMADINGESFIILNRAYHPSKNPIDLYCDTGEFVNSNVIGDGTVQESSIETVTVEELISEYEIAQFSLVADIEGAEYELIDQEIDLLHRHCSTMIIEFHGEQEKIRKYCEQLERAGFELVESSDDVVVFKNRNVF